MLELKINKELQLPESQSNLDVEMEFHPGKVTGIIGDSGAGKTTILRLLAGLSDPDTGTIINDGITWFDSANKTNLKPQKRQLGFVFQDHQLFPNMSVFENLKFANSNRENLVVTMDNYLAKFGLSEFKNNRPNSLSVGQKKRVAIIGAMMANPKLLLLDEPLAALDEKLGRIIQDEILNYTQKNRCITVLVTHELSEIFYMTDYLYSIQRGKIISQGSPSKVFNSDASKASVSLVGVVIENGENDKKGWLKIIVNNQLLEVVNTTEKFEIGDKIFVKLGTDKIEVLRY